MTRKEINKQYRKSSHGKEATNKAIRKYRELHPIAINAHRIVFKAIRSGRLIKSDRCEGCGESGSMLNGHHDDYLKPLDVRWLCFGCHKKWHIENGKGLNAD